jgi:hypothetical protein
MEAVNESKTWNRSNPDSFYCNLIPIPDDKLDQFNALSLIEIRVLKLIRCIVLNKLYSTIYHC